MGNRGTEPGQCLGNRGAETRQCVGNRRAEDSKNILENQPVSYNYHWGPQVSKATDDK